jgi:hypothetical protein
VKIVGHACLYLRRARNHMSRVKIAMEPEPNQLTKNILQQTIVKNNNQDKNKNKNELI